MCNRIELGEIENAINSLDDVDMCCCLYDIDNNHIVAIYSGETEIKIMQKMLVKKLPRDMIPNVYHKEKRLYLYMNGKIDRAKLKNDIFL